MNRNQTPGTNGDSGSGSAQLLTVDVGPAAQGIFTTRYTPVNFAGKWELPAGAEPFNLATHVGDNPDAVQLRRQYLEAAIGRQIGWMNQTHSTVVAQASAKLTPDADGLLLDSELETAPGAIGVLVADCVPVLLADTAGRFLAAVHAGRVGMLNGIVMNAVEVLQMRGVLPADIWAVIGPSICGQCYEVSAQLQAQARRLEPASACVTRWGTPGIDVTAGVQAQLERAGVVRVKKVGICTYIDEALFSYRREGETGRLAGIIWSRNVTRRKQCSSG